MNNTIYITGSSIQNETESTGLTKWQKRICKWFNITPLRKYHFTVSISIKAGGAPPTMRDIYVDKKGNLWTVLDVATSNRFMTVATVSPILKEDYIPGLSGELQLMSRSVPEI